MGQAATARGCSITTAGTPSRIKRDSLSSRPTACQPNRATRPASSPIRGFGTPANCGRAGSAQAIDNVAFVRTLLDSLKDRVPYDTAHVYCVGHSNGGSMAFRLGAELSDRLTAIGVVAGMMAMQNPRPKRPLPTLFIVGTKDPLMPLEGGEIKLPWGTRKNPPVAEPLAAWVKAIGCASEPQTISDADGLKKVVYPSKAGGPTLTAIYIDGQGHNWPGGKRMLPASMAGPSTDKLDATAVIWEFFKAASASPSSAQPANR